MLSRSTTFLHSLLIFILLALISFQTIARPYKTLVAPIAKDNNSSLYSIIINSREYYVIDLDAPFTWFLCKHHHPLVSCRSHPCLEAQSYLSSACSSFHNTTKSSCKNCIVTPVNPVTKTCARDNLTYKDLMIYWTNGENPTIAVIFNHSYASCAPLALLQSLPAKAIGVGGLSSTKLALPMQFAPAKLGVARKFALCLPSTITANGVIFFGDGPYNLFPPTNADVSSFLSYTPLIENPKSLGYYIGVDAISINGQRIKVLPSTLALDALGHNGVKLSTIVPYTTLRSDIYKTFLHEFTKATSPIARVKAEKPFDLCLNVTIVGFSRVGLEVPQIDLELNNGRNWTIYGSNSMKEVSNDVACLAFVDGGKLAEQAVVIGSYQMENNFLVFDLAKSMLGFSSSLYFVRTTCGNFNFTVGD
ncbi:hypothetical protein Ancab_013413 [Ancistrocladus abbreviatus]